MLAYEGLRYVLEEALAMHLPNAIERAMELHRGGDLEAAEAAYREIVRERPDQADAWDCLGMVLCQRGDAHQGAEMVRRALLIRPESAAFHNNLGSALQSSGDLEAAAREFEAAVRLDPSSATALTNLGSALYELGRVEEALTALSKATQADAGSSVAYSNLGAVLAGQNRMEEAVACYKRALEINPEDALTMSNLGGALKGMGRLEDAIGAFRLVLQIDPGDRRAHSELLLAMYSSPAYDGRAILAEHRKWARVHVGELESRPRPDAVDPDPERRLRIGYVSADLREHPVARVLLPLLANHDRARFEIICYSASASEDAMTADLRRHCDGWHSIVGLSDERAAGLIRSHKIDILIDLQLHGANNRLPVFAHRPATVQASHIAYPGTSGLAAMDYRFTDELLDPAGETEAFYTERLARLRTALWCYACDETEEPVGDVPALTNGFVTFGSLCDASKNSAVAMDLWSEVLKAVPGSKMMLLVMEHDGSSPYFVEQFARRGIEERRLVLVSRRPRREYMRLYQRIDIVLDTLPFNGHITTFDALWMGVPVVSLRGATAVGRGGESILNRVALGDLVSKDAAGFVRIATELAGDISRLKELRAGLRETMHRSCLCDGAAYARNVEELYRQMWRERAAREVQSR